MRLVATALFIISGAMGASAQTSFDQYFAANKAHRIGQREAAFLKACGVNRDEAQVLYGLSTENEGFKFHRTSSLLRGREEAQTDFFGSAEVWKVNSHPRFINAWLLTMDVGSESNEMFCLDENGEITLQESLNGMDGEVSGSSSWIYVQRFAFGTAGKKQKVSSGYVRSDGSSAPVPKLDSDDAQVSKVSLDAELARDVIEQLSR